MTTTRPKIAELVFQLWGRNLHPELFEAYRTKTIERKNYQATIQITSAGHVVTWQWGELILTEVATSAHFPLPTKRQLISHPLGGPRHDEVQCQAGITYSADFALEAVEPEAFAVYQKEFALAGAKEGHSRDRIMHQFDSSGRFGVGAISYVHVESRDLTLKVQALHTFPDDCAIMKSQSVFKLPS